MTDLIPWFLEQLNEDWHTAHALTTATRMLGREPDFYGCGGPAALGYWKSFSAVRALAAISAKRRIISMHIPMATGDCAMCAGHTPVPCPTIRLLVMEYEGRSGWRSEWKP